MKNEIFLDCQEEWKYSQDTFLKIGKKPQRKELLHREAVDSVFPQVFTAGLDGL